MESLHNHTTLSDGTMSHAEIFDIAERLGFSVFAFTDHDALPNDEQLRFLESVRGHTMKWIIGIEMTAGLPKDMGGGSIGDFHIIGLFVDPKNAALLEHCRKAQDARRERMERMVANLQGLGFRITAEDCLRASGGESVGRPHIVMALKEHPENKRIFDQTLKEMEEAGKSDHIIAAQYRTLIEEGESHYPFRLFLSKDAFRPAYVEHSYMPDMDEAVRLIRAAGGVASIAHYYTIAKKIPLEKMREFAEKKRLDAFETVWGSSLLDTSRAQELHELRKNLRDIAAVAGIGETGGADAHIREHLEHFCAYPFAPETTGMTARILASGRGNREYSSLLFKNDTMKE